MNKPTHVLRIDASGRFDGSTSRALSAAIVDALERTNDEIQLTERDLTQSLPHVDQPWIQANFTDPEQRDDEQIAALALSDALVEELRRADVIVIGTPVYNFGVPAALKAWIDLVARARLTFRYTENGPEGLLEGKRAWLAIASGGTEVDSDIDFVTPYLRHVLAFLGIDDVTVIAADRQMARGKDALNSARQQVDKLFGISERDAA